MIFRSLPQQCSLSLVKHVCNSTSIGKLELIVETVIFVRKSLIVVKYVSIVGDSKRIFNNTNSSLGIVVAVTNKSKYTCLLS